MNAQSGTGHQTLGGGPPHPQRKRKVKALLLNQSRTPAKPHLQKGQLKANPQTEEIQTGGDP